MKYIDIDYRMLFTQMKLKVNNLTNLIQAVIMKEFTITSKPYRLYYPTIHARVNLRSDAVN